MNEQSTFGVITGFDRGYAAQAFNSEAFDQNPTSGQRAGAGAGLHYLHSEPVPGRDEVLQPDPNPPRKARQTLRCSECGKPAKELYIVRPDEEICERCLTPEDLVRYPDQARKLFGEEAV